MTHTTPDRVLVHPLSAIRAQRGLTLEEFARRIARRSGALGLGMSCHRQKVWRWENRDVVPDRAAQRAIADELGLDPAVIDHTRWPHWLPDDPARADYAWTRQGQLDALTDAQETAMEDRRGFIRLTGGTLLSLAADWRLLEPERVVAAVSGAKIDATFVDDLESGLPRLRRLEGQRGGSYMRDVLDAELALVTDVLARSAYTNPTGKRLSSLAGEIARMAGWASFDAGYHSAAQRYWMGAIHAAHVAGDRPLGANILKSMSLQCYDFGHLHEALALARSAREGAGPVSDRTLSMLALREARAHAALGDTTACERLIADAERSMTDAAGRDPDWLAYFDTSEFAAQVGTCYLDLGRPRDADTWLARAIDQSPDTKLRDRATYLIRRAAAQVELGEVDHACHTATASLTLLTDARSARNARRLKRFRSRLAPYATHPSVRDLDDRLARMTA